MSEQLLTVSEAAARLGLCPAHVRAMCASGQLRAQKLGKTWVVRTKDLDALRRNPPGPRPKAKG